MSPALRSRSPVPNRGPRRGTTLVELLVALVVVTVGLLGLAGSAALVSRELGASRREVAVTTAARNRLERLTSGTCRSPDDGTAAGPRIIERWTIVPASNGMSRVAVTAEQRAPERNRSTIRRLEALVPCL